MNDETIDRIRREGALVSPVANGWLVCRNGVWADGTTLDEAYEAPGKKELVMMQRRTGA